MAPTRIPLLEPEELNLGLDAVDDVETHGGRTVTQTRAGERGSGGRRCFCVARECKQCDRCRVGWARHDSKSKEEIRQSHWPTILSRPKSVSQANWLFAVLFQNVARMIRGSTWFVGRLWRSVTETFVFDGIDGNEEQTVQTSGRISITRIDSGSQNRGVDLGGGWERKRRETRREMRKAPGRGALAAGGVGSQQHGILVGWAEDPTNGGF